MKTTVGPATGLSAMLLGLAVGVAAAAVLFPLSFGGPDVRVGDRAPRVYRAQRAAQYESEVVTEQKREQAAANVNDVYFPPDPSILEAQRAAVDALVNELATVRSSTLSPAQKLTEAQNIPGAAGMSSAVLGAILDFDDEVFADFRARIDRGMTAILEQEVLAADISGKVNNYLDEDRPALSSELVALREILNTFVIQNVEVDERSTEAARQAARAAVPPQIVTFAIGQEVAREGERLEAPDIEALEETGIISAGFDPYRALGGGVIAVGVALLVGGGAAVVAAIDRPASRKVVIVGVAFIVALAVSRLAFPAIFPDRERLFLAFALPFATVALLASALAGFSFAAIVSVALGLMVSFVAITVPDLPGSRFTGPLEAFELAAAVTVAGIAGAPFVARRYGIVRFLGAAVAAAAAVSTVLGAVWLFSEPRAETDLVWIAGAASVHGAGGALLSWGVIWFTGRWVGVTAATRLSTLSRGDHPLLRRLQDEAPGTYHHSMMVATLAEAAARRIGADAELARVGAMFHDIGKLAQPRYYVENTLEAEPSPHADLAPEDSAARIREHVTNGTYMARASGLPSDVARFIPEHHGTRLIVYFYREAMRELPVVDVDAFRYAGPKPQSRETAIVMLADSCEATVRANQSSGSDDIEKTVDMIIAERTDEGELDESGLSVRDVRVIAATFKESLRALHHRRIAYPPPVAGEFADAVVG